MGFSADILNVESMNWKNKMNPKTVRVVDSCERETRTHFTIQLGTILRDESKPRVECVVLDALLSPSLDHIAGSGVTVSCQNDTLGSVEHSTVAA